MKLAVEYNKILSYVTYINHMPIIRNLSLFNDSEVLLDHIKVQILWEQDLAEDWLQEEISIEAGQMLKLNFENQPIQLVGKELAKMTEGFTSSFQVIVSQYENIIVEQRYDMDVLAYDQWLGSNYHPALIASFVTPNAPIIAQIIQQANVILKDWNLIFSGYQTQDKNDVRAQMKAIYLAIQRIQINYLGAAPNFEKMGQRIRLADQVIATSQGNCIEVALLYAACLEYVGLNPLLIIFQGHAFTGCWLEDQTFHNSIEDDFASISKRIAKGVQWIEVVETTLLTQDTTTYEAAVMQAQDQLSQADLFEYIVDICQARWLKIRPLPQKAELLNEVNKIKIAEAGKNIHEDLPEAIENTKDIEVITSRKRSRLKVWESKLLNLTLRNNLLNFRPTKRTISILEGDLGIMENYLSSAQEFALLPCPPEIEAENREKKEYSYTRQANEEYHKYMNMEMKNKRLVTLMSEKDLDAAIKSLYYDSRTEMEENGANTLFMAMGFLKWYETDMSKQARYAPILLYPIEMIRKSSLKGYVIRYRDEEIQINTTLLEKMRMELNLEFPGLIPLPEDEQGIDIEKVMNTMRTAILNKKGWDVVENSYIGLFSFNQFVMWNDIHSRSQELMDNPIVGSLMQGYMDFQTPEIIDSKIIDDTDLFVKNAILMPADSSQLEAIYSASAGSSFVLHGPPGTGKSQTISNIIASALYNNKSVLFVAEKMAALNVVQTRLEKIGIGDFALELHSNKSKKGEVLTKIGKVLDKNQNGKIKEIKEKRANLYQLRDKIKETNEALHKKQLNGYSVYEMITLYEEQATEQRYPVGSAIKSMTKPQVENIARLIERLHPLYQEVQPVSENSLGFICNAQISFKEREKLKEYISQLGERLHRLENQQQIFNTFIAEGIGIGLLYEFVDLVYHMIHAKDLLWHYLKNYSSEKIDAAIYEIISKGKEAAAIKNQLLLEFQPSFLQQDGQNLLLNWNIVDQKWIIGRWIGKNKWIKQLSAFALQPNIINKENAKSKLELLVRYQNLTQETNQYMQSLNFDFGTLWQEQNPNWLRIEEAFKTSDLVADKLRQISHKNNGINIISWLETAQHDWLIYQETNQDLIDQMYQANQDVMQLLQRISDLAGDSIVSKESSISEAIDKVQMVLEKYLDLDTWLAYVEIREGLYQLGIKSLVDRLEQAEIAINQFKCITLKSIMYDGIIEIFEQDTNLANFHHYNFEYLLEQYRKELDIVTEMTRLELIEKLVQNIPKPTSDVNVNSELGIMMKAIKSKGRGISLRSLFDRTPNVLRKIAPCMLMSPISVAQYIDPTFPKFDMVIFDEASQVNTHSAVGAIARGNQLIVVGDPNQLPPTSFFKGNFDDQDMDFDQTDQDSILDECQAIMFPELRLKWHYRSKHESLIAFSNSQYYENKLNTFPAYNDLESKVKLVEVAGFYDRSGSKENLAEAKAIIEEIKARLSTPRLRKQSIGVVTFSSVQQKLIQTKLDEEFASYPELEDYAQELEEEIFVKNLENVQGDERDVILFSVGYGPDKNGKVTMNFGPLNQRGGWKRLNVVVSRSREEMIVYSTLKPEQIDLSRTDARGVLGLKRFLEFARNKNSLAIDLRTIQLKKDELIEEIAGDVETLGYQVVTRVGKSNYRIDMAVVHKQKPNQFMAAIILDGYQYYDTPTVRDKIVVQPFMLKRLQWNVIRVWTVDWFKNKSAILEMIRTKLMEVEAKQLAVQNTNFNEKPVSSKKENIQVEYIKAPEKTPVFYQAYPLKIDQYDKEEFYQTKAMPQIISLMQDIINFEAPIVEEDLFHRIIEVWGMNQIGSRIIEILNTAANKVSAFSILDGEQKVYWRNRQHYNEGAVARKYQNMKRKFQYICKAEIEATILDILAEQISLDFKNLCKEVFKFHGYNMLGEGAQNDVLNCLNRLITNQKIIQAEERFLKQ